MKAYPNLVDGASCSSDVRMDVTNPRDGAVSGRVCAATPAQAQQALVAAQRAARAFARSSLHERNMTLQAIKGALLAHNDAIARLIRSENGNHMSECSIEAPYGTSFFDYFIEETKRHFGQVIPDYNNGQFHYTVHEPVGVVVSFLPFNYPVIDFCIKLGIAIATGNASVVKPSPRTPLALSYIGELLRSLDLPKGLVNIVNGDADLGRQLCASPVPRLVTLVGSNAAGLEILRQSATSVKKYSLELGGNAPLIVCEDADVAAAATTLVTKKCTHAGQNCMAPNRVFVHESRYPEFCNLVVEKLQAYRPIDPTVPDEDQKVNVFTPLISEDSVQRLLACIDDARQKGATILHGGTRVSRPGFYLAPTVIKDATPAMRVFREEQFGPVLALSSFTDRDDIFALANDTDSGLAACLFTSNARTIFAAGERLQFGSIMVNSYSFGEQLPHGGLKQSGYGKGMSSLALHDYFDVKRVAIKRDSLA